MVLLHCCFSLLCPCLFFLAISTTTVLSENIFFLSLFSSSFCLLHGLSLSLFLYPPPTLLFSPPSIPFSLARSILLHAIWHSSQERHLFDTISLLIQESLEGELKLMDNLSGSVCHHYALPTTDTYNPEKQVNIINFQKGFLFDIK